MSTDARKRLEQLTQLATSRDNDYYARAWLGDKFYKKLISAYIDGKKSITVEKRYIDDVFKELCGHLRTLGYTVTESSEPSFHGEVDYVTIAWQDPPPNIPVVVKKTQVEDV